ncbi:MAG: hypothetical protein IKI88_06255 [Anaerotignum sp.]|nr:hypothetical protein [Anaerotignum sp.]
MKKCMSLMLGVSLLICAAGCQNTEQKQAMSGAYDIYEGYLTVNDNQLIVDDFKFIDLSDGYWIDSLELTEKNMPNGYYIYNPSDTKSTFALNEETRYNFYDTDALFISDDNESRMYTTKELSEFLKKFDLGNGELGKTPFEIQVLEDGRVISIREIFVN